MPFHGLFSRHSRRPRVELPTKGDSSDEDYLQYLQISGLGRMYPWYIASSPNRGLRP
jgi:hypothetical protein